MNLHAFQKIIKNKCTCVYLKYQLKLIIQCFLMVIKFWQTELRQFFGLYNFDKLGSSLRIMTQFNFLLTYQFN